MRPKTYTTVNRDADRAATPARITTKLPNRVPVPPGEVTWSAIASQQGTVSLGSFAESSEYSSQHSSWRGVVGIDTICIPFGGLTRIIRQMEFPGHMPQYPCCMTWGA